jgi:hypothetical protein
VRKKPDIVKKHEAILKQKEGVTMCEKHERNKGEFDKGFLSRLFGGINRYYVQITPIMELEQYKSERLMWQKDKEEQGNKSIRGWLTGHRGIGIALVLFCAAILCTVGCSSGASEEQNDWSNLPIGTLSGQSNLPTGTVSAETQSKAEIAIGEASRENKYIYLVFYKQNDPKSEEMKQVAAQAQKEVSARADVAYIDVADESEKALIEKYGIATAPPPVTLVMAPNGAIVDGFAEQVSPDALKNAFVSPKMAEVIKAIQDKYVIYLYIANPGMTYYTENLATIQTVMTKDLKGSLRIITVDPADKGEASLLEQCKVSIPVMEPNLLIVNSGYIVGNMTGKIDRQALATATLSGCSGSGCCSSAK